MDHDKSGEPITIERIKQAVIDLYDSYDAISDEMKLFIENAIDSGITNPYMNRSDKQKKKTKII